MALVYDVPDLCQYPTQFYVKMRMKRLKIVERLEVEQSQQNRV
jgi:hypothetical protein